MKKRLISILTTMAMLISAVPSMMAVSADQSPGSEPISFTKTLIRASDSASGIPDRIKLEAYTTGSATTSTDNVPTDIVLVLDQSGSMADTITGGTKLDVMKTAVTEFVAEVEKFNQGADSTKYRVAIVGFSSESGYNNTEILTLTPTETIQNITYETVDPNSLDTNQTYYISTGDGYEGMTYEDLIIGGEGWYTSTGLLGTGLGADEVNIQSTTIYKRIVTTSEVPSTEPGIQYADLTSADYATALIDCTAANIGDGGAIKKAIDALDAEGATRVDLGMKMAQNIFDAQPAGTYTNRKRIVMALTDGVPTTSNSFSETVANSSVSIAKTLKSEGVHIFSTYLGTPDTNSASFLQALSSNYPDATAYDELGTKAADSYYKAHADASGITSFFGDIVYNITADSELNEVSVVTDTISEYFELPVELESGAYDPSQITIFTSDNLGAPNSWGEEVAFPTAHISIEGKTIKITGFNFGAHCVTTSPKDGDNGTNYGRKLVIYIPITEDASSDTFGGWLTTNEGAEILLTADAQDASATAPNQYNDVTKKYSIENAIFSTHIHDESTYDFYYTDTVLNPLLTKMITSANIPTGKNNTGVDMVYIIRDTNFTDNKTDDEIIAQLVVPAGQEIDPRDFANWEFVNPENWEHSNGTEKKKTLTIGPNDNNIAQAVFSLECTLTNVNNDTVTDQNPLETYGLLSVNVSNSNVHIVGGVMDRGGTLTVPDNAPGELINDGYSEKVTEGESSAEMTFEAKDGYEISQIVLKTTAESALDSRDILYDIADGTNKIDADGDGTPDYDGGIYTHQFENVQGAATVEVYTRLKNFTLTTVSDTGSEIRHGGTYTWSEDSLTVYFAARDGYEITEIYAGETQTDAENTGNIIDSNDTNLIQLDINDGKVIGGDVFVSRKQNNYVKVVSQKISYNVTYKYYTKTDSGYIYDDTADIQKTVLFGDPVPYPTEEGEKPGDETTIADAAHTLKGWFSNVSVTGQGAITGFTGITNVSELVMGASDLVFHAFWEKNPNVEIVPNPGISKWYIERELDENENPIPATLSVAETAEFVAVFQEHIVGRTTIEVTPENNDIYTDGSIKIVLTDAQKDVWVAGTPIYIYEVRNSENTLWIYDDTVYTLEYTGYDNGEYQYHWNYANGDPGADGLFFENVEAPYLVRYNLNGGMLEGAASRAPKVVSFDEGELVPSEAPVKSGYTFTGWTYNTSSVDEFSTYDALVNNDKTVKEITLVAQYSYNGGGGGGGVSRYTLYYESNGGTVFDNERYTSGTTVQLDKKPVKDGFVFDGWHLDKACMEDATEVRMTQNRTVYAAWLEDDGSGKQSMLNRRDHFAYVVGYPDGTVRPNASITRAEVTAIFFRLLNEDARNENITHTNLFEDIQPEAWYNTAISTMANLGIVKGRNGKLFSANDFITRAEFAAICARFDDSEFTVVDNFTDVEGHWAEDEIHEAAAHGWITGYANNIFKPDQNITRAEAMTMINRVLNRTPESSDDLLDNMTKWPDNSDINAWYYLAVQEATNSHDYQMKDEKYEKWLAINPKINWEAYQ